MSVESYAAFNFGRKSEVAADLFDRMESECRHNIINLTPVFNDNGHPAFLTAEMSAWYWSYVQAVRSAALSSVIDTFHSLNLSRGATGFLFEHEKDRIEITKLQEISRERETFLQNKDVAHTLGRLREAQERYEQMKAQLNREAIKWTPVRYWFILFCFMLPEFLINWDSFLKIPGFTMAYATGLIIIVAVAFAFSAHSVGRIVKQWKELFGGHIGKTDKAKSRRELLVGIALFLLGISAVGWGRWYFIQAAILEKSILKGGDLDISDILQFVGAMLGNIIVYLLGVLWSFAKHDSMPEFSELRSEVETLEARRLKLFERFLTSRNQQHIQNAHKAIEKLSHREALQKQKLDRYNEARQLFGIVRRKDDEIVALLNEYRVRLVKRLKDGKMSLRFRVEDIRLAEVDAESFLSIDQYALVPMQLPYL